MGTLYSDIYIDGMNTEILAADGAQIKEAWLNGECIWKLANELTIIEVYHIVHHDGMYYVLFRAGVKTSESVDSDGTVTTTWKSTNYYIGCGNEIGSITDIEEIKNETYRSKYAEYFIAQECDGGLFVYYAEVYGVASSYMYFEDYDIHAEKDVIDKNPFGEECSALNSIKNGLYLNGIITNKYIINSGSSTLGGSEHYCLRIKDLAHNLVDEIVTQTLPLYLPTDGKCVYYVDSSETYETQLRYEALDINSLETKSVYFDYSDMLESMFGEPPSGYTWSSYGRIYKLWYIFGSLITYARIYYQRYPVNGWGDPKSRDYIIDITNHTFLEDKGDFSPFQLRDGYLFNLYNDTLTPVRTAYIAHSKSLYFQIDYYLPGEKYEPVFECTNSCFKGGIHIRDTYSYRPDVKNYLLEYTKTSYTITEVPEIKILYEEE